MTKTDEIARARQALESVRGLAGERPARASRERSQSSAAAESALAEAIEVELATKPSLCPRRVTTS